MLPTMQVLPMITTTLLVVKLMVMHVPLCLCACMHGSCNWEVEEPAEGRAVRRIAASMHLRKAVWMFVGTVHRVC